MIVVLGTIFTDIKGYPEGEFHPSGRNTGHIRFVSGGVGRNVAVNLANIGTETVFLSLLDPAGNVTQIRKELSESGIDTGLIRECPEGSGMWLAVFDETNEVYASVARRADLHPLLPLLKEKGKEIFRAADAVVLEMDADEEVVGETLRIARELQKPVYGVISNIRIASKKRDLLSGLSCFVVNLEEAGVFFETDLSSRSPEAVLSFLKEHLEETGISHFVITMGNRGSVFASRSGESGILPAEKVKVTDTTGAGDAFFSGVAAGLALGKSLKESCTAGAKMAENVIRSEESTCRRFLPEELWGHTGF